MRRPAAPVAQHIQRLIDSGWSRRDIADSAGMLPSHVSNLRLGYQRTVDRTIADAVLALEPLRVDPDYIDPVLVDRLAWGLVDWRTLDPQPSTRIRAAAAETAWARWGPIRRAEAAWGIAEADKSGESLASIERRLSLRAGRDFNRKADVA
jgi:transcriptional regulator with XRE-family HTH domain